MNSYLYVCPNCRERVLSSSPPSTSTHECAGCGCSFILSEGNSIPDQRINLDGRREYHWKRLADAAYDIADSLRVIRELAEREGR